MPTAPGSTGAEKIALYDPDAILAALDAGDGGRGTGGLDIVSSDPDGYSPEERQWRRTLRQIAEDPRGPWRDVLVGTPLMASAVAGLDTVAPHFGVVTRLVKRAVVASASTGTRLRLPPICLVGPPGVGKTFYARRLAGALGGVHLVELPMNMLNDRGRVSGYSMSWKGARASDLTLGLLAPQTRHSSFVAFFDEIDKVDPQERVHDVLLSLLEPENARRFVDEYLTGKAPLRLDHVLFLATANDVLRVPEPLLDRMLVVDVGTPAGDELRAVVGSVYASAVEPYGPRFCPFIDDGLFANLAAMSPRQMRRALELAVPAAIEAGRWALADEDLATASEVMAGARRASRIGFTPP